MSSLLGVKRYPERVRHIILGPEDGSVHKPSFSISEDGYPMGSVHYLVEKYDGLYSGPVPADVIPFEVVEGEGNLLMYGGASCLWECLIGNGTGTAGQALTYFSNAQAALGTGDSQTGAAATQFDLQASTNKGRQAMDSTYPQHTDGTTSGSASIIYKMTTSGMNWHWYEWGVFNSPTAATGRMLLRKQIDLGNKVSGTWSLTATLTAA